MEEKVMVSVILPVYNTKDYLVECLESIVNQTIKNIEIICVDDGSTDGSLEVLEEYAGQDSRIIVVTQENKGGGAARNRGLEIARGEYLFFPDSDDYYKLSLLEEALACARKNSADIVIFRAQSINMTTGKLLNLDWAFKSWNFPSDIFSFRDAPDFIFTSFSIAPWTRLYKRSLIEDSNICFQPLLRTNDLFFTCCSLIAAQRIALLDSSLVFYRVGCNKNCQATNHLSPFDFYRALSALKAWLEKGDFYTEVGKSYFNFAMRTCIYNLDSLKEAQAFCAVFEYLRSKGFRELGFDEFSEEDVIDRNSYNRYIEISQTPLKEYLFNHWKAELKRATTMTVPKEPASRTELIKKKVRGFRACLRDHGAGYTFRRMIEHFGIPMNAEIPRKRGKTKRRQTHAK